MKASIEYKQDIVPPKVRRPKDNSTFKVRVTITV